MSYRKEVYRSLSLITQLGISVMVPIFLCILAGHFIDKYFGTSTLLVFLETPIFLLQEYLRKM